MTELFEPILGRFPESIDITNSEIQTFKDCRRKWYLNYYLGLKPREVSKMGPLPLGTRVHDSLELYYTDDIDPVITYNKLAGEDKRLFLLSEESNDESKEKKFDSELELGRIMVEGYKEWIEENNLDADMEFVSAEKAVNYHVDFDGTDVNLMGKIDLKMKNKIDDTIHIVDHKTTAASAWQNYTKYSHMSEQLMYYITLSKAVGEDVDGAIYNLLKKVKRSGTAKPPFYDRITVRFNPTQLDSFWNRTMSTVNDIVDVRSRLDDGESHLTAVYPRPSNECSWKCDFFKMCTMMDDGSSYDRFLGDFYEKRDPNERYGKEEK